MRLTSSKLLDLTYHECTICIMQLNFCKRLKTSISRLEISSLRISSNRRWFTSLRLRGCYSTVPVVERLSIVTWLFAHYTTRLAVTTKHLTSSLLLNIWRLLFLISKRIFSRSSLRLTSRAVRSAAAEKARSFCLLRCRKKSSWCITI